ncbi:MAG: LptF/LptG family permease [Candidatus Sericytochromatia bacterium]|nr:LptF/LptG family permease [Candidatus Sericytochromatia bacterium]
MLLIDRYIVLELVKPFLLGVLGFVVIMLANTLYLYAELIVHSGVSVEVVAQLLAYNLPAIIVVTFPVAYLFSTLLAIGRLSKDSEVTAMRSVGVSFRRILLPLLAVSLLVSYGAFWINDEVVPWANRKTVDLVREMVLHQGRPVIKENIFFKGAKENRYFYVRQVDRRSNHMYDVFIFDKRTGGQTVTIASEARWVGDSWNLKQGVVSHYDEWGALAREEAFGEMSVRVALNPDAFFAAGERSPQEKSSDELAAEIETLRGGGTDTKAMEVDYHMKFSLPLATFFSAMLAAPLGAQFSRMGGYIGVVFSIILVFIYYVVMSVARSMGNNGVLDPITGAWIQNYLFGVVGAFLLWRIDR